LLLNLAFHAPDDLNAAIRRYNLRLHRSPETGELVSQAVQDAIATMQAAMARGPLPLS
jgi:hypothetical protein